MAIDKALLDTLKKRREEALLAGGQDKIDARHKKGWLTARDRIAALFDPGTFQEFGQQATHNCTNFGMEKKSFPSDGVVTGTGFVNGSPVAAFAQDFTVGGGSLGERHAWKICDALDYALKAGIPVVAINDSGGARIQEGVAALSGYGNIFYRNVQLSGVVPQVTIIAGPCVGGAAYSPALTDFLIMVNGQATMAITGPAAIKEVTGQVVTMEDIGSAAANASISGNVHFVVDTDAQAVELSKLLLSYLPSNNLADPPHKTLPLPTGRDESVYDIIPAANNVPLDMQQVIRKIADDGQFLEVHASFARNLIVGFTRIGGIVTGIIANQPMVKAGTLDIDASDKGARFIRFCNIFNIPIVNLVDVPGFLPGVSQEHGGIIRHGAKMLFAYAAATVPKITLIVRKAYGGAYLAMCSKDLGADLVFAWPTAEIAVMGAEGAVGTLFKREIDAAGEKASATADGDEAAKKAAADAAKKEKRAELLKEYRDKFYNPYVAAGRGFVTDVIDPAETRAVLALALRTTLSKREIRPAKKHGNIPL